MRRPLICASAALLVACQTSPPERQAAAQVVDSGFVCPVHVPDEVVQELCETEQTYLVDADAKSVGNSLQLMGLPAEVDHFQRPAEIRLNSFSDVLRLGSLLEDLDQADEGPKPEFKGVRFAKEALCETQVCAKGIADPPPEQGSPEWLTGLNLEANAKQFLEALDKGEPRVACAAGSNRIVCDVLEQIHGFDSKGRFHVEPIPHLDVIPQHSILATLPSHDTDATTSILVGAHLDSWLDSPGVEDNLSGVVTMLTMMQAIVDLELEFDSAIHFAFYAGEEAGSIGSCRIRKIFGEKVLMDPLKAALNFDMVGRGFATNVIYVAEPHNEGYGWEALPVKEIASRHFKPEDVKVLGYDGAPSSDNVTWATACKPTASFRKLGNGEFGDWYHKKADVLTEAASLDRLARLGLVLVWEVD